LPLVLEPKIDGISVSLIYAEGHLERAVTRGDGRRGDVITAQVLACDAVPARVPETARFEVRGELYLPQGAFEALNERLALADEKRLANPRNACASFLLNTQAPLFRLRVEHEMWRQGVLLSPSPLLFVSADRSMLYAT
jgi:DNA ligase (NAD+)